MGYISLYNLELLTPDSKTEITDPRAIAEACEFLKTRGVIGVALNDSLKEEDWAEWYNCDKDMTDLSMLMPNILFRLTGTGESEDDRWQQYFLDGLTEVCFGEMIYPPFDPANLKAPI